MNSSRTETRIDPRIMILDDDPVILQGLSEILEKMGCEVLAAASSEEARSLYMRWLFDLVLLNDQ